MAVYKVEVFETRTVFCQYKVEANSSEEANQKAQIGDTIAEEDVKSYGVSDRNVEGDAELVEDEVAGAVAAE